jgi:hypothetical protein
MSKDLGKHGADRGQVVRAHVTHKAEPHHQVSLTRGPSALQAVCMSAMPSSAHHTAEAAINSKRGLHKHTTWHCVLTSGR